MDTSVFANLLEITILKKIMKKTGNKNFWLSSPVRSCGESILLNCMKGHDKALGVRLAEATLIFICKNYMSTYVLFYTICNWDLSYLENSFDLSDVQNILI